MADGAVWIDVTALAARIGVSRNTVWRWVRNRSFPPPVRMTAGCSRWRLAEVEKWEAEQMAANEGGGRRRCV